MMQFCINISEDIYLIKTSFFFWVETGWQKQVLFSKMRGLYTERQTSRP